jgi:hypothetical protein
MTMKHSLSCGRCGARAPKDLTSAAAEDWSGKWERGRLALVLCPRCQTPADSAEAEVNAAMLRVNGQDGGRFEPDPVICMTGTTTEPGAILYGDDHLRRVLRTGRDEEIRVIQRLPEGTRCVAVVGGVVIHPARN